MVISFQRSGLNWLRYCTEYFTGVRTPGRPQIIAEGPVFFDRAHDVRRKPKRSDFTGLYDASGAEVYERVALLLRNPYDCFTSHYFGRTGVNFKQGLERFEAYANNINQFDALKAKKGVFYFEDFVNKRNASVIRKNMAPDFYDHDGPGGIASEPAEPPGPGGTPGDLRLGLRRSPVAAQAVLAGSLGGGRHDRLLVTSAGQPGAAARAPACLITVPPMC